MLYDIEHNVTFSLYSYLNIYISSVHMLVNKRLLNGSTDFDEICCVSSGGFHNGLD